VRLDAFTGDVGAGGARSTRPRAARGAGQTGEPAS